MRIILSIKPTPGGGKASQATRYIAYGDRDEKKEGTEPRKLFSAKEDDLSFWKANRILTEEQEPKKEDLMHFVISFRKEDFEALGRDEAERQQSLKEVSRRAISQFAEEIKANDLRWVAGIHRNTEHPHIHLIFYRTYLDRETGREKRLTRMPEGMLTSHIKDDSGIEKTRPGFFNSAFESALDRAGERARDEILKRKEFDKSRPEYRNNQPPEKDREKVTGSDERLLEAARRNPSLAGRELIQEIILRGPQPDPDERPEVNDIRVALRAPSLDDPDYRTQPEQADWLGRHSQELRDLYERGAEIKGDVLIVPAEEYELPEDRNRPFITNLSFAHEQIQNSEQASEFHTLARTIAGQTADPRTEIEVFRYYYNQIRREDAVYSRKGDGQSEHQSSLEQTLGEMRLIADEMSKLETRESIEIARPVISFEETREAERAEEYERNFLDEKHESESESRSETDGRFYEEDATNEGREPEIIAGSFNAAARKVNLRDENLRLPEGLNFETKERLVTRTLPAIDRLLESGKERTNIFAAIEEKTYDREVDDREREERFKIGVFLKAYVDGRLNDPETKALNNSAAFRLAYRQINEARTPEELNRAAEDFLRENFRRSHAIRLHQLDPQRYPKLETLPLNARERSLLFFGRSPEHHTPEMRELKFYWGLSRHERAERVRALHNGKLAPSPTLETMLVELDSRRTLPALRHFQAAIINKDMNNPGKLNLREMYERLPPHERTYLIERIEHLKQARDERIQEHEPLNSTPNRAANPQRARAFGAVPKESGSYREYMARMGEIELRLLNEAVGRKQNGHAVLSKESGQLTITEARSLLSREEQIRIREHARNLAWEQITPPQVFSTNPDKTAVRLSDMIAHLHEDTQQRARLAHRALDEFVREKVGGKNAPITTEKLSGLEPADSQRLKALEDYAARMREELYRGFESLDMMRSELEKSRIYDETGRHQFANLNSYPSPHSDQIPTLDGHTPDKNLHLGNGAISEPDRNPNVGDRPEDREQHPWLVDSTRKWHFESVRDLAESLPAPIADQTIERDYDFSFDR